MTIVCSRCGGNHMRSECPTLAAPAQGVTAKPIAYAIYGIGGGKVHLHNVKPIKDDEWSIDDDCLGDYWSGNVALYAAPLAEGEPAAVRQALVAINAAHESMFVQCCSNPIKNAWGKDVDVSLLNEAHRLADIALASLRSAAVSDNRHPWYGPCDALGPQGQCAECMKLGRRSPAATAMLIPMRGPDCACCESQPRKDCTVPGCTMKDADYALAASCSQPEITNKPEPRG